MYRHNSTIKIKTGICSVCGKPGVLFSRGRHQQCATIEDTQARMNEETEKAIVNEGLSGIIERLDDIYSKWIRLSNADEEGRVECYTCKNKLFWTAAQCGHYKSRGIYRLRWDTRNTRVQDQECNEFKGGNLTVFAQKLETESPGILDILDEDARLEYKLYRHELNQMIVEYTQKFKALRK